MANEDVNRLKPILRVTTTDEGIANEIAGLIAAAQMDLISSNVDEDKVNDTSDALIWRAICLYAKANFGFDNPDADRLMQNYDSLRIKLSLDKAYRVVIGHEK